MTRRTLLAVLLFSSIAHADPTAEEKAQADAFFREARALMSSGKYPEACGKFAESHRLDPAPGTLVNLALCHEKEGKTASAWAEFNEVAERPGDDRARAPFARTHAHDLEARLSRLRVKVEGATPDEVVTIDGRAHGTASWGAALPLDPGAHVVEASAPGKKSFRQEVRVEPAAQTLDVAVPKLEDAPVVEAPRPAEHPAFAPAPQAERGSTRTIGYVVGGVGIAALAVGTIFGVRTLGKKSDADALCPNNKCAGDPRVKELDDAASTSATISTIGFGVGVAALATGVVLVLVSPGGGRASNVAVAPIVSKSGGGAGLLGRF